jgi:hypothetical protein
MKTSRFALTLGLAVAAAACGGNHSADTIAQVMLSANITSGPADVDISVPVDVTIPTMSISSQAKSPDVTLSQQQDVILSEWVVTPVRTDGGTIASPVWRNFYTVYVPAGGSAALNNYRIFPAEYFNVAPLVDLFPVNGGLDAETGNRNIRQRLDIEVFGKTVSGDSVSLKFPVDLNFFYVTP